MKRLAVLFSIVIFMLPLGSSADASGAHPIDAALTSCIDKDPSTEGMTKCIHTAYAQWDKELNSNYSVLLRQLPPKDKQLLKAVQKEWIAYRDKEFRLMEQIYSHLEGTMYIPAQAHDRLGIVKQRALQLKAYADTLKEK
jgi:uncharacterized protein YecT (DUF1311 family)